MKENVAKKMVAAINVQLSDEISGELESRSDPPTDNGQELIKQQPSGK